MTHPVVLKNLDEHLIKRLQAEAERRQSDVPTIVEDLLKRSFAEPIRSDVHGPIYRDVSKHSQIWSESEFQEFERNTACLGEIDQELWN